MIFECGHALLRDNYTKAGRHYPIVLSHVSRRFRGIVTRTSSLWTDITLSLSPKMLDLYLLRSRACHLDIRMDLDIRENCDIHRFQEYMQKISRNEHVVRWGSFHVRAMRSHNASFIHNVVMSLSSLWAPQLREIEIAVVHTPTFMPAHAVFPGPVLFVRGAPVLSVVKMDGVMPYLSLPPPASVESFQFRSSVIGLGDPMAYRNLCRWLCAAKSLHNLVINPTSIISPVGYMAVIEMRSLRSMEICMSPGNNIESLSGFLRDMIAPNLTSLTLTSFNNIDIRKLINILEAYPTSSLWLGVDTLGLCDTDVWDWIALASFLPSITHISVIDKRDIDIGMSDMFLEALYEPVDSNSDSDSDEEEEDEDEPEKLSCSVIWPDLDKITLNSSPPSIDLLCNLIEFRSAIGKPLSRITLDSLDWIPEDSLARLREQVQVGTYSASTTT